MTKTLVNLDEEATKIVELYKGAKKFRNKSDAINSLIKEVKNQILEIVNKSIS